MLQPLTQREGLRRLVTEKNRWARPLSEVEKAQGFRGWHERGVLPHCDFPGLVQFVTFRLEDSLPATRRGEWACLLAIESARERRAKLEEFLDRGLGSCRLREPRTAGLIENALRYFHGRRYELLAWCVMPNHVHVLLRVWQTPLWKLVRSWKQFAASRSAKPPTDVGLACPSVRPAGDSAGRPLALRWQREYWDTFMRDETQERKAVHYIENNPVKARLCRRPEEWPYSSARFRDEYRRLKLPERPA